MVKFEVLRSSRDKQWWGRIVAKNGRVLFQTEMYKRKGAVMNAFDAVRHHFRTFGAHRTMTVINLEDGPPGRKELL